MDMKIANVIVKTNQQNSMFCTLIDNKNDVKLFKILQWNYLHVAVFPLEFWTFSCQSYLVPPSLPISLGMDTQLAVEVLVEHMPALKFIWSLIGFLEIKLHLTVFGMEFQLFLALL